MLFEDIMLIAILASSIFFIGIPVYKFVAKVVPRKRNPLVEAKVRLEQAKIEVEAAKLNKQAEKLYDELYEETLDKEEEKQNGKF